METIILTVLSILFSAIFGVFITRYYYKKQMKKKEITHFLIKTYDIGKGLKDLFPGFKISYNNEDLAKHVRVYEGLLKNTGYHDVYDNNIAITMLFPENCVVKAVRVVPSTGGLIVKPTINGKNNEVQFIMGKLFKSKQSFEYTAIVESSASISDSSDSLAFSHMLPDTDICDGNKQLEISEQEFNRVLNWSMYITLFCGLIFIILAYFIGTEYPILHGVAPLLFAFYCLLISAYRMYYSRRMRKVLR